MAAYSLKRKKDFARVFKKGKGFSTDGLFLKVLPGEAAQSRFGIVVSQKISKKATVRNKVRRRIRAAINQELPRLRNNFDAVVLALPGIEKKDFWEIKKTIKNVFSRRF